MMRDMGDEDRHFWLTRSVGRAMGINFSTAISSRRMTVEDYAEIVKTCQSCANSARCQEWLSQCYSEKRTGPPGCLIEPILRKLSLTH